MANEAGADQSGQERKFHFSSSVQPLIDHLSAKGDQLPLDIDQFLKEMGDENAIKLVTELVEQGATGGQFFADALALVRFDKLPKGTKDWFEKEGVLVLGAENIRVNLRHKDDLWAAGCHEVGQYIIDGTPRGQDFDVTKRPTYITAGTFTPHEMSERFPRGALAEVNIWDKENARLRYTVAGTHVAGGGPNARGIMVPTGHVPIAYIHTRNSFEAGKPERNFYIKQAGMHNYAWYGLEALGMYLKGEIPARS